MRTGHLRPHGAVLFDCDGTLADSEPLCERAWAEVLRPWGYEPRQQDFHGCQGISYADTREYFAALVPGLPDAPELYESYWAELRKLYQLELRGFADTVEALRVLR